MAAPFFDPSIEHDACGVGFIAALDRSPSYRMTRLAVECLHRLDYRGARAADGITSEHTASPTARSLLSRFPQALDSFWVIAASDSANTRLAGEAGPSSVKML